jgi:hypothetical protein
MGRCQSVMSQNPEIWVVCAEWYRFKGDDEKVCCCKGGYQHCPALPSMCGIQDTKATVTCAWFLRV